MRVTIDGKKRCDTQSVYSETVDCVTPRQPSRPLLFILGYWDLCEINYQLQLSLQRLGVPAFSVTHGDNYIHYRQNYRIYTGNDWAFTNQLVNEAEIVDVNEYHSYRQLKVLSQSGKRPRMIIVHHGIEYRNRWQILEPLELDAGYTRLITTFDLFQYSHCPESLQWLPHPIPVKEIELLYPRRERPENAPFRIAHAATVRANKGTDQFLTVCQRLQKKGLNIEPILIERRQHHEALWIMSQCDAYFASLLFDLGAASYEAMVIGLPVLCYADPRAMEEWNRLYAPSEMPFIYVTHQTLEEELERLVASPKIQQDMVQRGKQHVKTYHDSETVARRFLKICESTEPCKKVIYEG